MPLILDGAKGVMTQPYVTSTYTATAGQTIIADATGGSFTISLPASPSAGDLVEVLTDLGTSLANTVTVSGNGKNIFSYLLTAVSSVKLGKDNQHARFRYNGTSWKVTDQSGNFTGIPKVGDFTWVNQGSSGDALNGPDCLSVFDNTSAGLNNRFCLLVKSVPSTPYSIIADVRTIGYYATGSNMQAGFLWRDSSSGKLHGIVNNYTTGATAHVLNISQFTSPTVWSSNPVQLSTVNDRLWYKLRDDGTNISAFFSADGYNWMTLLSSTAKSGAWMGSSGYNQICFGANPYGGPAGCHVYNYIENAG
jgi:hypothetical protein